MANIIAPFSHKSCGPSMTVRLRMARTRHARGMPWSICKGPAKHLHSTRGFSTTTTLKRSTRYLAAAGAVGAVSVPGLWWLAAGRDEVPSLDDSPTAHVDNGSGLTKDEVTRIISQGAYSVLVRNISGVGRYDGAQLASNSPCEDRFIHGRFPSPWKDGSQWMAWAVFDGHVGWQTADLLEKQLLSAVRRSLSRVNPSGGSGSASDEAIQEAVRRGFVDLDDSVVKTALETSRSSEPLQDKVEKLVPAYAGSCALLSLYDPVTSTLYVACTGDSRAVLGRKTHDGRWEALPLSVDQTGSNKDEVARISSEHPGEQDIAKDGRILGLMVSRAFGDGRWKWPLELQQDFKRRFYGPAPLTPKYDVRTPPYLTAEPVVTATKVDLSMPSFLIIATDGMWDNLSNQQAVDLVRKWRESVAAGKRNEIPGPRYEAFDFSKFGKGVDERFVEGRTTVQDDNAAVHLMRNSLGGNHHELIAGRLAFSAPFSRRPRDDITVQVVLFTA